MVAKFTKEDLIKEGVEKGSKLEVIMYDHEVHVIGYVAEFNKNSMYLANAWHGKVNKPLNLYAGINVPYKDIMQYFILCAEDGD